MEDPFGGVLEREQFLACYLQFKCVDEVRELQPNHSYYQQEVWPWGRLKLCARELTVKDMGFGSDKRPQKDEDLLYKGGLSYIFGVVLEDQLIKNAWSVRSGDQIFLIRASKGELKAKESKEKLKQEIGVGYSSQPAFALSRDPPQPKLKSPQFFSAKQQPAS